MWLHGDGGYTRARGVGGLLVEALECQVRGFELVVGVEQAEVLFWEGDPRLRLLRKRLLVAKVREHGDELGHAHGHVRVGGIEDALGLQLRVELPKIGHQLGLVELHEHFSVTRHAAHSPIRNSFQHLLSPLGPVVHLAEVLRRVGAHHEVDDAAARMELGEAGHVVHPVTDHHLLLATDLRVARQHHLAQPGGVGLGARLAALPLLQVLVSLLASLIEAVVARGGARGRTRGESRAVGARGGVRGDGFVALFVEG